MRRRDFVTLLGGAACVWPLKAHAQQSTAPVVGWLNPQPLASSSNLFEGFQKGLGEAGYIEGKNVMIELRSADGKRERLLALAEDLVQQGVSVIMAGSLPAALAAKRATQTIPIVFTSGADPVKMGLVSSYNRPDGNITGFHIQFFQLVKNRFSLLHEVAPEAKRIAVLNNPSNPSAAAVVRDATETAREYGLGFNVFNAGTVSEIDTAFRIIVAWRAGAVFLAGDPLFYRQNKQIAALTARHSLPASGDGIYFAEAGGLMSYGPNLPDFYRRAGFYVGRILKGEKPANLPVQQPTVFKLTLNLKAAKDLDIIVPHSILLRTDQVVE